MRPYKLPNLDNEDVLEEFNAFVVSWENEWLLKIFGRSFYDKFIAGVSALPPEWNSATNYFAAAETQVAWGVDIYKVIVDNVNSKPSATNANWAVVELGNRWLRITQGTTYTWEAHNNRKYTWAGLVNVEKFAVFSLWLKASVLHVSGVSGNVAPDVQNGKTVSSAQDISSAWNKFAKAIGGKTCLDVCDTLYGFLLAENKAEGTFDDTFDESFQDFFEYLAKEFRHPGNMNRFNL